MGFSSKVMHIDFFETLILTPDANNASAILGEATSVVRRLSGRC